MHSTVAVQAHDVSEVFNWIASAQDIGFCITSEHPIFRQRFKCALLCHGWCHDFEVAAANIEGDQAFEVVSAIEGFFQVYQHWVSCSAAD